MTWLASETMLRRALERLAEEVRRATASNSECASLIERLGSEKAVEGLLREGRLDEMAVVGCNGEVTLVKGGPLYVNEADVKDECAARGARIVCAHTHPCGAAVPSAGDVRELLREVGHLDRYCVCRRSDDKLKCLCIDVETLKGKSPEELSGLTAEELRSYVELYEGEDFWEAPINDAVTTIYSEEAATRLEEEFKRLAREIGIEVEEYIV